MASDLTEQVALKLAEQRGGDIPANFWHVFSKDATELIALITEACASIPDEAHRVRNTGDKVAGCRARMVECMDSDCCHLHIAKAIRALGEVKE